MAKITDWDDHIGRRLRLRDLRVFFAVVQSGSLAKAATQLRVSQPAVSQVIADLEHALGIKLFDRSSRGVEPTIYARALLARGRVAFDELRQGIKDIEFLADPTAGELRIGYPESIATTILPLLIERFFEKHPRVLMITDVVPSPVFKFPGLLDRTYDLFLARMPTPLPEDFPANDLNMEVLFDDSIVLVAGTHSPWARRRKIDLAELAAAPWILSPPGTWLYTCVAHAFSAKGLDMPKPSLISYAMDLRVQLPARGQFIAGVANSVLRDHRDRTALKKLPIDLPQRPWQVVILTLKNRTLSPVVERFIDCARKATKELAKQK
jgi:DNA-binding transcriptional LysR family regulator